MPIIPYENAQEATLGDPANRMWETVTAPKPTIGEAFHFGIEGSPIGSAARWLADKWDPTVKHEAEPGFDVFEGMENTPYAQYAHDFIGVTNHEEAAQVRRRIDRELYRNEQMANVSLFSLPGAAELIGNVVGDPTVLVPGGEVVSGVRLGRPALVSAGRTAAAGFAAGSLSEAVLQATQETRTAQESATNILLSTALSGGLGGLASLRKGVTARIASRADAAEQVIDTYASGSVGAAQAGSNTTLAQEGLKSAFGLEKVLTPTSPLLRAAASPSIATRRTMQQLAEDGLIRAKNADAIPNDIPVTRRMEMYRTGLADAVTTLDDSFINYRFGRSPRIGDKTWTAVQDITGSTHGKLTRREFAVEVGKAMLRDDTHDIPEVARAAKMFRAAVFDPLKDAAIENGLLPPGIQSKVAKTYLSRLYDREKIAARRKSWLDADGNVQEGFEDRIVTWLKGRQDSMAEELSIAESAVRAASAGLEKAQAGIDEGLDPESAGKQFAKARSAYDKSVDYRLELDGLAGADESELRSIAGDITDKILNHARSGFYYGAIPIERGPLKELTFTIPTHMIEDFLDLNIERVAKVYNRVMSTDVELTRRFGRPDMEEAFAKIRDDYKQLRQDVTDPKQLTKLDRQMEADLRDIAAVRDRLRGTYAMPANPNGILYRTVRSTKTINFLRSLGGMVVSSIPDAMRPVFLHGPLRVTQAALLPLIANSKGYRLAAKEAKLAGAALEMALDGRALQIGDLADDFQRHSKFERGLDWAAEKFGLLTLMNPWTVFWKQFSGVVSQSRTLDAISNWRAGTITKKDIERLANMGIDEHMAGRIHDQFTRFGEDQGALKWANTQAWDDAEAQLHYRAALAKEIDKAIVTPGQEKPLWMSGQLGQIIGQFQGYNIASMQRVLLAGLQQRDASALSGFLGMSMAGMLAYWINAQLRALGHDNQTAASYLSDDPKQWVLEGLDRGGTLGYAFTFDRALDLATRGNYSGRAALGGEELSRYRQRTGAYGLLGPTVGDIPDVFSVIGATTTGEWSSSDIHTARTMIPMNNVFYWRWLFDEAEDGISGQ